MNNQVCQAWTKYSGIDGRGQENKLGILSQ